MKKLVGGSLVLGLGILAWGDGSLAQKAPTPRGELRIVEGWSERTAG
jgi:hypothetical protein